MKFILLCSALFSLLVFNVQAADKATVPSYEDDLIRLRLIPRTAEQMSGFYEARGFPAAMIKELSQYCFFTVVIKNKSPKVVWLDMGHWNFSAGDKAVRRIPRSYWPPKWTAMHIPLSAQSTFRWTLLPEALDFQPDESEGGNIILEKTPHHFSLKANFDLGKSRDEGAHVARIDNLECVPPAEKNKL